MTVIALEDGEPIGTVALTEHDMETHREHSREPYMGRDVTIMVRHLA